MTDTEAPLCLATSTRLCLIFPAQLGVYHQFKSPACAIAVQLPISIFQSDLAPTCSGGPKCFT